MNLNGKQTRDAKRQRLLQELRRIDGRAAEIRKALKVGKPGEEIWQWECGDIDEDLLVIADGYGGATLAHVEGDGDNRLFHRQREFDTEAEAEEVADKVMNDELDLQDAFEE